MYHRHACAACRTQGRKCTNDCVFASCFPPDETDKFLTVHQVFGGSNVGKLLKQLHPSERVAAANSLYWEAQCRIADPVYGCVGPISLLQQQLNHVQTDFQNARHELAQYIGDEAYAPMQKDPALSLIRDGAAQACLWRPLSQGQEPRHGMVPMMGVGSGGQRPPLQQQVYGARPLSAIPVTLQLFPLGQQQVCEAESLSSNPAGQQQQVYEARPLSASPRAQHQLPDYSTDEGQQLLLRLSGHGHPHQDQWQGRLTMFNLAGGSEASSSGNAHVGGGGTDNSSASGAPAGINLNQLEQQKQLGDELSLSLNQQQQPVDGLGLTMNQQQQLGDEPSLNLNPQQQDEEARLAELRRILGVGPPSQPQPPGHPQS